MNEQVNWFLTEFRLNNNYITFYIKLFGKKLRKMTDSETDVIVVMNMGKVFVYAITSIGSFNHIIIAKSL